MFAFCVYRGTMGWTFAIEAIFCFEWIFWPDEHDGVRVGERKSQDQRNTYVISRWGYFLFNEWITKWGKRIFIQMLESQVAYYWVIFQRWKNFSISILNTRLAKKLVDFRDENLISKLKEPALRKISINISNN